MSFVRDMQVTLRTFSSPEHPAEVQQHWHGNEPWRTGVSLGSLLVHAKAVHREGLVGTLMDTPERCFCAFVANIGSS